MSALPGSFVVVPEVERLVRLAAAAVQHDAEESHVRGGPVTILGASEDSSSIDLIVDRRWMRVTVSEPRITRQP